MNKRSNAPVRSSTRRAPTKSARPKTPTAAPPKQSLKNRFPSGKQQFMGPKGRDSGVQDEYIQDINGSVSFTTTAIPFNPGQSSFLPRFSKEAVLYEKWICTLAEPYFKPMVSAYATNGQSGKVLLSFDYDASDSPPATKQQVEDTDPHSDAMPYEFCRLSLDPSQLNASPLGKYVRPGGLPGSADIKSYDGGVLYVSTIGNANTSVIGELRIRYHFKLVKPVLESLTTAPVQYHVSQYQSTSTESVPTSATAQTILFATNVVNGLGATNSSGIISLPAGNYLVTLDVGLTANSGMSTATVLFFVGTTQQSPELVFYNGESSAQAASPSVLPVSATYYVSLSTTTTIKATAQITFYSSTANVFGNITIMAI